MIFEDKYKEHIFIKDVIPLFKSNINENTTIIDLCCRNGFFINELINLKNNDIKIILNDEDKHRAWFYTSIKVLDIDKVYSEYLVYKKENKSVSSSVDEYLNENNQIRKLALYIYIYNNDINIDCLYKLKDFLNRDNLYIFNEKVINIINKATSEDTVLYINLDVIDNKTIASYIRGLCKYTCKSQSVIYQSTNIPEYQNNLFSYKHYKDGYLVYYPKDEFPDGF